MNLCMYVVEKEGLNRQPMQVSQSRGVSDLYPSRRVDGKGGGCTCVTDDGVYNKGWRSCIGIVPMQYPSSSMVLLLVDVVR